MGIEDQREGEDMKLNATFEMSGKGYRTDKETLKVLRSIVPAAKKAGDFSAVVAVMVAGLKWGKIVEMAS